MLAKVWKVWRISQIAKQTMWTVEMKSLAMKPSVARSEGAAAV